VFIFIVSYVDALKDEMNHWYTHNADKLPQLSADQRKTFEYLTGNIPLLLRGLLNKTEFDQLDIPRSDEMKKVANDLSNFHITMQEKYNNYQTSLDL
jgi:hypothetical protein